MAYPQKLNLGIVAHQFFDMRTGRMGGFGWAAARVANLFNSHPQLGVKPVFLSTELSADPSTTLQAVHDTKLLWRQNGRLANLKQLWAERLHLLLCIEYLPPYRVILEALPFTPAIIWVRFPRAPEDMNRIRTLRIPGKEAIEPEGARSPDCRSLARVVRTSRWLSRPILFATIFSGLAEKISGTYGVESAESTVLPNPINLEVGTITKSDKPKVVILGRLDPIKRPWICFLLAEKFPQVEFQFVGQSHFQGAGAWEPADVPGNVKFCGHLEGPAKVEALSKAWLLLNTSIFEGLPVSFLEALYCETPIISCLNPDDVVSRFGIYVGRFDRTGVESVSAFATALDRLLTNQQQRLRLGREGRQWVERTHSEEQFLSRFSELCTRLGHRLPDVASFSHSI